MPRFEQWFNLPPDLDQRTPNPGQVEPQDHFFLRSNIFTALDQILILIIAIDRRHPELGVCFHFYYV